MERLFQLIEKLVASLRYVWVHFREVVRLTYDCGSAAFYISAVRRKQRSYATVFRVRSGEGASSVIPLTKRIHKRRPRAKHIRATGRWTLARHGTDSLTPLGA